MLACVYINQHAFVAGCPISYVHTGDKTKMAVVKMLYYIKEKRKNPS